MALENPNVWDASYQHPASYDRSAVRLVVYLFCRPDDKAKARSQSEWTTVPKERRGGDARGFIRAADARTREIQEDAESRGKNLAKNKAPWCASFVHLALVQSREALIRVRTQLINHVRGTVKAFGARLTKCTADSFYRKVSAGSLPPELEERSSNPWWWRPSPRSPRGSGPTTARPRSFTGSITRRPACCGRCREDRP